VKFLFLTALSLVPFSAFANLECFREQPSRSFGWSMKLVDKSEGRAQIIVTTVFHRAGTHRSQEVFNVSLVQPSPGIAGAPMTYRGNGVELRVNFTTAPRSDGTRSGTLRLPENGTIDIVCKR
jgi:hypothetical protein